MQRQRRSTAGLSRAEVEREEVRSTKHTEERDREREREKGERERGFQNDCEMSAAIMEPA
jgi:hypothetical protein